MEIISTSIFSTIYTFKDEIMMGGLMFFGFFFLQPQKSVFQFPPTTLVYWNLNIFAFYHFMPECVNKKHILNLSSQYYLEFS